MAAISSSYQAAPGLLSRLIRRPTSFIGLAVLAIIALAAILAAWLARRGHDVLAIDVSRAACASAAATATANGVEVEVLRADGLSGRPITGVDLVVCNPPFHLGTTKDSTPGFELLRGAVPALDAGAEVWTVFNSHLPYLPFLRAEVGPTRVVGRNRGYTVTRSRPG